ncbi:hypothetical protein PFISCL1PPCAC_3160, partial [Pristionchus fissidentatus]
MKRYWVVVMTACFLCSRVNRDHTNTTSCGFGDPERCNTSDQLHEGDFDGNKCTRTAASVHAVHYGRRVGQRRSAKYSELSMEVSYDRQSHFHCSSSGSLLGSSLLLTSK